MIAALEGFGAIAVIIAVGWALAASGILGPQDQKTLARLVYYVATPALLVDLLVATDVTTVFGPWFLVAVLAVLGTLVVYVPVAWRLGHGRHDTVVGSLAASYANAGYLGLPVAAFVLGDAAFALPTIILQVAIFAPLALPLLQMEGTGFGGLRFLAAGAKNPVSVAAAVGVALSLLAIELPTVVADPVSMLGAMAVPGALLAFGISLRSGSKIAAQDRAEVLFVVVLKIVIQPLIAWVVAVSLLDLSTHEVAGVTLMAALPSAQNVYIYASHFKRRELFARDAVALSTMVSLPVLVVLAAVLM